MAAKADKKINDDVPSPAARKVRLAYSKGGWPYGKPSDPEKAKIAEKRAENKRDGFVKDLEYHESFFLSITNPTATNPVTRVHQCPIYKTLTMIKSGKTSGTDLSDAIEPHPDPTDVDTVRSRDSAQLDMRWAL